jgi:hypothetical protein
VFFLQMSNVQDARREMTKTKEQLEEEKKISLSIRIKPLELDGKAPFQHPDHASQNLIQYLDKAL